MPRSLSTIAREIRADWKKPYFGAEPYIHALFYLDGMASTYGYDSARTVVGYFLSNASKWRGDTARRIKAELKDMLKG